MSPTPVNPLLNRLLAIAGCSFPQYLQFARPYIPEGRDNFMETIHAIVLDQNGLAERISQMVLDGKALPRSGDFPIEYTDTHDLGIDFLVNMAITYQQQDIQAIGELANQLQLAPAAKSLAEEALGMAKGHLESLRELVEQEAL
tara:strand:+ start:591 stop:1022 length:432 start_codon:yes stop_codon:yes gene_type:complete